MPAVIERHVIAGPELQDKLAESKAGIQIEHIRTIRCPSCGFYLLDVYGHDHYYIRVKCRKLHRYYKRIQTGNVQGEPEENK